MLKLTAKSWNYLALITMAVTATLACGSSSSSPGNDASAATGASGVDGAKRLDALTTEEKKKFCDFSAAHYGGYGHEIDCGGGNTLSGEDTQAQCLSDWPTTCAMTVSQAEKCTNDWVCANFPIPTSCAALLQCQ